MSIAGIAHQLRMTPGEVAAAMPLPTPEQNAELQVLRFERNAYRDRCHALERMVAYLLGREPDTATLDQVTQLEAQRNMLMEMLAAKTLPAAS